MKKWYIAAVITLCLVAGFTGAQAQSLPPSHLQGQYIPGKIYLTWDKPNLSNNQLVLYRVYKTVRNGSTFHYVTSVINADSTHYWDPNVLLNSTYKYYVTAVYAAPDTTESVPSDTGTVMTTNDPGPPQPPTSLTGWYRNGYVHLNWDAPDYPIARSYYIVYRHLGSDTTFHILGSTLTPNFLDTSITLDRVYDYVVTAFYQDSIESPPSDTFAVKTNGPAPPEFVAGYINSDYNAVITWDQPDSKDTIVSYRIFRSVGDTNSYALLGTSFKPRFIDSTIDLHTESYYYAKAVFRIKGTIMVSGPSNGIVLPGIQAGIHFNSTPVKTALIGQPYTYQAMVVTRPVGHRVCFSLDEGPRGMKIDSTGLVRWTPVSPGWYQVQIVASICDTAHGQTNQMFYVGVFDGPPGSLQGVVQNGSSVGLANVTMRLFDIQNGSFVLNTKTDSTGHYRFPAINPSTYFLRARPDSASGLQSRWYNDARFITSATPIIIPDSTTVTVNMTMTALDSTALQKYRISGTVTDTSSQPVPNARVNIFILTYNSPLENLLDHDDVDRDIVATVYTDSSGNYSAMLPQAYYILGASKLDYYTQFWDKRKSALTAKVLNLMGDTTGLNFSLVPHPPAVGLISGTIYSSIDSTSPVHSIVVGFHKLTNGNKYSGVAVTTTTDSAGNYTLTHLIDGSWVILALPHGQFIPTFYDSTGGTPFHYLATPVPVSSDTTGGINIYAIADTIGGLNTVNGHVGVSIPGAAGRTVQGVVSLDGAIITVTNTQNGQVLNASISDDNGAYSISGLAPGNYILTIQQPGYSTETIPFSVNYNNNMPGSTVVDAQLVQTGGSGGAFVTVGVAPLWNMLSLPVTPSDTTVTNLFPDAKSGAFIFTSTGYNSSATMKPGIGYWLKFGAAEGVDVPGAALTNQVVNVTSGWNMIGALSIPISTTSITQNPPGIVASYFFGYTAGYYMADTLQQGMGYWIKVSHAGTLTMASSSAMPKGSAAANPITGKMNSLTLTDISGTAQTLYFGNATEKFDSRLFEMPPPPPPGIFDARFIPGQLVEVIPATQNTGASYPIQVRSQRGSVTIKWSIKENGWKYSLTDASGKLLTSSDISGNASARVIVPKDGQIILKVEANDLPTQFALRQNYPNPFNPTTVLSYDLPVASHVTLTIYNTLGQLVRTLVNSVESAGFRSVNWDGNNIASGVYFYRIQATGVNDPTKSFTQVKKMVLIK
ncbi:MAG: carboxypeptidase regulatory-like domain-containing protein [Bacteroidota bacterium]